uniref:Putative secreted protein n=1 Tax=Ixodes ricinus TaxID=34613 RepID=A0A147BDL5_IXORI
MLRRMAAGSFLLHLSSSSCILPARAGLSVHRQPLRWAPVPGFSIFSKHLFRDRLCRTEFFQPLGAVRKYGKFSVMKL